MNRRKFIAESTTLVITMGFTGLYWKRRWKYIVIHHSAGPCGNLKLLQQVHQERQSGDPINAIPYHYIIGNGRGMAMGEIASDWRQSWDLWGAHVSFHNFDHNFRGLGICLIGNYEKETVPAGQYQALVQLTRRLMKKYNIPAANVTGHGMIPGEATKCPGKNFPMEHFKTDIVSTTPPESTIQKGLLKTQVDSPKP